MNLTLRRLVLATALGAAALLAGCSSTTKNSGNSTYDFGPAPAPAAAQAAPPMSVLVVTDVTGVAALDSERMFYRLAYSDPLRARSYANSRWASTPLSMVTQRIKSRLSQSGIKVLATTDAAAGMPILRMEIDDFTHTFDSATQSYGQLVLRASLFHGHKLIDQRVFNQKTSAATLDAAGGARALAESTDAAAAGMLAWLATLQLLKQ
ncbi:ABC-type transport auxiliary lipoprotein family protein [Massilia sp. GCM10020059]|uniref:PqiC family protein n=1 Tax=Massilia agrisoli TaxID=2892444 RepID=A0ABS8ITL1_9BURK|nr:ABC-type transport auxiliary lipoprotein family protein [Massilia agrisoli]MCC6070600.1 PqiC family protein [Massilia agrisoli]